MIHLKVYTNIMTSENPTHFQKHDPEN